MSLGIQKYTDKCIVIRGDTKAHKDVIKSIKMAKFGYFGGEPGWMFPLTMEAAVRAAIKVPAGYVDGPKQKAPSESSSFQRAPSGAATGMAGITSDMIVQKAKVPSARGTLRGPPINEDDDEVKVATVPVVDDETKQLVQALLQRVAVLEATTAKLQETVTTLTSRLDAAQVKLDAIEVEEVEEESE